MPCYYPLQAYFGSSRPNGKRRIVFKEEEREFGTEFCLPCGRCIGCRLERSRQWAIRCMHEAKLHDFNSFVTLTYSDDKLPKDGSLNVRHFQLFMKRLRRKFGNGIKYFHCGEYSPQRRRPHYHAIIFGVSRADVPAFESSWSSGFVHVGDVSFDSACYVASYTLKKMTGPKAYVYEDAGVIPEFSLMSRGGNVKGSGGIGAAYCDKNKRFLKDHVFCVVKGNKVALPRYYRDKLFTDLEMEQMKVRFKEVNDEAFRKAKAAAGVEEGYEVMDYQRSQHAQRAVDLSVRQGLKRRKI